MSDYIEMPYQYSSGAWIMHLYEEDPEDGPMQGDMDGDWQPCEETPTWEEIEAAFKDYTAWVVEHEGIDPLRQFPVKETTSTRWQVEFMDHFVDKVPWLVAVRPPFSSWKTAGDNAPDELLRALGEFNRRHGRLCWAEQDYPTCKDIAAAAETAEHVDGVCYKPGYVRFYVRFTMPRSEESIKKERLRIAKKELRRGKQS